MLVCRKMPDHSGHISPSKGLASIDRSEKTAQLGTAPRPRSKSSTNDIEPPRLNQLISCLCLCRQCQDGRCGQYRSGFCQSWPPKSDFGPSISLPPGVGAPIVSLHFWAGFRLKRRSVLIPQMVASHHWSFDQAHKPNV